MELILWRHADAEDANSGGDSARRLTKRGRKQAERMARWLRPRLEGEWRIVCSPAQRALETAEPLRLPFEVRESVSTAASARSVLVEAGWPDADRVLVVGHQPTLGEVAALLLGVRSGEVAVRKGAVLWFAAHGAKAVLKALVDPDMLDRAEKGAK